MNMRLTALAVSSAFALVLAGCSGGGNKCAGVSCPTGQFCDTSTGTCTGGTGGGSGGSSGGGTGGTGGSTGGGTGGSTGGGAGGSTGGGTGGSTGGGTGGSGGGMTGPTDAGMIGGETCGNALTITAGTFGADTTGATGDYLWDDTGACRGTVDDAPDTVYKISVPSMMRLTASTTAQFDVVMNLIAAPAANCGTVQADGGVGGLVCLAGADQGTGTERATWSNLTGAAVDVFIVIDGYDTGEEGAVALTTALDAVLAGDTCSNPITVTGNVTAQPINNFSDDYRAGIGCVAGTLQNDRVYMVSVPGGQRLTAAVTPDVTTDGGAQFDPSINLVTAAMCTPTLDCVNGSNAAGVATDTVIWDNTGSTAQNVLIVVDTSTTAPMGTFRLDVSTAVVAFAAGESCGNAGPTAITASMNLAAQLFTGYANNYNALGQTTCSYGPGPDRTYLIDIPAGMIMTAVATQTVPDGGVDLTLTAVADGVECGHGPCLVGADSSNSTASATETVVLNSPGTTPRRVRLVVDSKVAAPATSFGLNISIVSAPAGDNCGNAIALAAGMADGGTTAGFSNDLETETNATNCTGFTNRGPEKVFGLSIPTGKTLTATVTPEPTFDPAIYLLAGPTCPSTPITSCLAGSDANDDGMADTITWTNNTGSTQNVFLVIDRFGAGTGGAFSLNISIP